MLYKFLFILFNLYLTFLFKKSNNLRIIALLKSKKYINFCVKGILINNYNNKNKFKIKNEIKITVVIPIFNCEKSIKSSLRSIQNQNMSEIEILLVNDFSSDNSLIIIEDMAMEDSRIKIINNKKNMGTLFSRCIGTLLSKGKYIFPLDNDDLFIDYDLFDIIYRNIEKENYDIIGFKAVHGYSYNKIHISELIDDYLHDHPNNLIVNQPDLGIYSITKNNKFALNDIHIWGKCINKEIYIKAINALGKERYSYFISWAEDTSMVFILFNIAKSYKFISKYGIFHLISEKTSSYTQNSDNKTFAEIFLLEILLDFSKNNFNTKKFVVEKALEIKNYAFFHINNNKNYQYLKKVLEKLLKCKFISEDNKFKIKQYFNEINLVI